MLDRFRRVSPAHRDTDDCNIYVRSERAGQRVMKSITQFITQKLKLKVNESKSAVARPQQRKFLGFSFTDGPEVKRAIAPKALGRFKRRVREITRRAKGVSIGTTIEELAPYMRGWRSYFGFCETPRVLVSLTCWVRARLRMAYGDNGKQSVVVGQLSWHWASGQNWRATRPVAAEAPGTSPTPKPCPSRFPMATSHRSASRIWRMHASVTISNRCVRTRTHGGVAGVSGQPLPLCRSNGLTGEMTSSMILAAGRHVMRYF